MSDKLALCVGNNYPDTPYKLSGCVNDAQDWTALLESQGYTVTTMLEAPREPMLAALRELIDRAGYGDRVVLTFSGHGTWRPDGDGDEADGRDECLVAADMALINDDELQTVFNDLDVHAGGLILSDSCFSGTVSRFADVGVGGYKAPVAPEANMARARFLPPTVFDATLSEARAVELEAKPSSTPRRTANLISGAADTEYSWDAWFGDRANGAFTRAAIDTYAPGMSLAGWHRAIRAMLPSDQYPQTPQLTSSSEYRRYADAL